MERYDETTALIAIDVQNDFANPDGSLYVPGGEQVVERVNAEIDRALEAGSVVVYTQDWHPPDTPHFDKDGGVWPVHCVAGSWGAELHPRLQVVEDAPIVRKGTGGGDGYSGFTVRDPTTGKEFGTGLEDLLRERGVQRTTVVGLATDYCVKETAVEAVGKGIETRVLTDAVRAVERNEGDGSRALDEMREAGAQIV
jgi:nicotinamidase/pyrazinamidase